MIYRRDTRSDAFISFFRSAVLISVLLFLAGCSAKYFSPGWKYVNKSENAWKSGNYSKALFFASEAIRLDNKLVEPKVFLKDHHDIGMNNINSRLKELNLNSPQGAKIQVNIYTDLDRYFNNLKLIPFPLRGEEGAWEWTTDISDYSSKLADAKKNAYRVYRKEALKLISQWKLEQAETYYKEAVSTYQEASKKAESKKEMKKAFTDAYYKRALRSEKKRGIRFLEMAIKDYEKAYSWDNSNNKAKSRISEVKNKIAEIYYKEGRKFEKRNKNKAVEAYSNALKWVEGYKDAAKRLKALVVSGELKKLEKNLKISEREFARISSKPAKLSKNIGKASDVLNKLTYISDTLKRADQDMKNISRTLAAFNVIPTVNNVTRIVGKVVKDADRPVHGMVLKFNSVEKPVITPLKSSVASLKGVADGITFKVRNIGLTVKKTRSAVARIKRCLERQKNPTALIAAGKEAKKINENLVKANKILSTINRALDQVGPAVKSLANMQPIVRKVADSSRKIGKPIKDIGKATHEIDKVLDKKISIKVLGKRLSTSIRKVLTGAVPKVIKKVLNKFSKLAMKALDPVFKKLKIRIPKIKGLDRLKRDLGKISGVKHKVEQNIGTLKSRLSDLNQSDRILRTSIRKMEKSACSR